MGGCFDFQRVHGLVGELFESKPTSDLDESGSWSMLFGVIGGLCQMFFELGYKTRLLIM